VRIVGDPRPIATGNLLQVFARGEKGQLVLFSRRGASAPGQPVNLSAAVKAQAAAVSATPCRYWTGRRYACSSGANGRSKCHTTPAKPTLHYLAATARKRVSGARRQQAEAGA
jgi:hypothetical protein